MLSEEERRLLEMEAEVHQALASAKRLEVLRILAKGEMTAGDLAAALGTSAPNLSQHLSLLRQVGVIAARKEGVNTYYSIAIPQVLVCCKSVQEVLSLSLARQQALLEQVGRSD